MDLQDLEKEIEKIRKKNHDISNLLMVHSEQLKDITDIKDDIAIIRRGMVEIIDSLSGGLVGQGLINRVENLESCKRQVSGWIKVMAAGILTLFVNKGWEVIKKVDVDRNHPEVVKSNDEITIESSFEDNKN